VGRDSGEFKLLKATGLLELGRISSHTHSQQALDSPAIPIRIDVRCKEIEFPQKLFGVSDVIQLIHDGLQDASFVVRLVKYRQDPARFCGNLARFIGVAPPCEAQNECRDRDSGVVKMIGIQ
jgi:hypothetical protein